MPTIASEVLAAAHVLSTNATTTTLHSLLHRQRVGLAATNNDGEALATLPSISSIILTNFLPTTYDTAEETTTTTTTMTTTDIIPSFPTVSPPSIENLVASSAEDLSNFRDVTFDIFADDDDLFGSPMAFDASENGLWNGRFVPPPPRPPFFVDEPAVLTDGLTTCDLCSWAMPTKSTFIFEGTIEKATELGWPLTLIIVSILSALLGAIIMVTVVRCKRKKASNNRNETHVQWWSRNKRPNSSSSSNNNNNNNNHLRRSNIYTAHPADSIRGLGQQQPSLSAASSLTTMTAMGVPAATAAIVTPGTSQQQYYHQPATLQHTHRYQHYHHHGGHHHHQQQQQSQQLDDTNYSSSSYHEHEYHQPQELQQLQLQLKQQHQQHQRQHSSSISSAASTPSLTTANSTHMLPVQLQQHHHHYYQHNQQQQPQQQQQREHQHNDEHVCAGGGGAGGETNTCLWPNATMIVAS